MYASRSKAPLDKDVFLCRTKAAFSALKLWIDCAQGFESLEGLYVAFYTFW